VARWARKPTVMRAAGDIGKYCEGMMEQVFTGVTDISFQALTARITSQGPLLGQLT
jgi:hypothetical protein